MLGLIVVGTLASASLARATVLFESDPDQTTGVASFAAAGRTSVGRLTVDTAKTIGAVGVLNNLENGANLRFFIANAATGAMLYVSAPQYFAAETGQDLNLTYKVSSTFSFTFLPGTTYAVGSIADNTSYTFIDPAQTNSANGFNSLLGNQMVSNYASPVLNTGTNCCSVGFELLDQGVTVPEPASLALLGTGLIAGGAARRRARRR